MIGSKRGPYEIWEEIGRGGMAAVYRVYQTSVDGEVAIKVILRSIALEEQARSDSNFDPRADIYSLGIVLFEALTGQLLFVSDIPMDVIMKQINEPAPRVCDRNPSLPLELNAVLAQALEKDRDKRYMSMNEFVEAASI